MNLNYLITLGEISELLNAVSIITMHPENLTDRQKGCVLLIQNYFEELIKIDEGEKMEKRKLNPAEAMRRTEFLRLKNTYNLTNLGIMEILPEGTAGIKAVQSWSAGQRSIPVLVLTVLKHKLEGYPIVSYRECRNDDPIDITQLIEYMHDYRLGKISKIEMAMAVALWQRQEFGRIA